MPSSRTPRHSRAKQRRATARGPWVERTLARLTLREKIGQMLMPQYVGVFQPPGSTEYQQALREIERNRVGGFIIGAMRTPAGIRRSQLYPTVVALNEFQRRSGVPLLVGADFENGVAMRIEEGTAFPSAMSIAATAEPALARLAARRIALESRAAGIHWIFAPDADVNSNPANPIINTRSFGEDPALVAEFVANFIRGAQENGALATAKHFPGHGNVTVDSHLSLATVPGSRAELTAVELVPFRAAIAARVSSIMPGHLAVPALDPEGAIPATLSRRILTGLLRDEWKFRGLIVTDALDMGGVANSYSPGEAAVLAVSAGADVLLMPPAPDAAIAALEAAVQSGRIPESRLDDSVRRILAAKARLGLHRQCLVDVPRLHHAFARPEFAADAQRIADRGATLLRNHEHAIPLDAAKPLRVLLLALSADPAPIPAETFEPEIRRRVDSLAVLRADTQFSPVSALELPPPESYDCAIAALLVRVADRKGTVALPDDQRALVNRLLATGKPVIVAAFGSPYLIEGFPGARTWLANFGTNRVAQIAAARAIFGEAPIGGKFPVTVPGFAPRGEGIALAATSMTLAPASRDLAQTLRPAFQILDQAVAGGAFPGGVLAIGAANELLVHSFGKLAWDAKSPAVRRETIYDIASLTKPIVTTTAAMILCERGLLDLDAPIARYLPDFSAANSRPDRNWRQCATVRMLLLHSAGLAAHREFFREAKRYDAVLARVLAEPLVRAPGTRIEYSDLGFILLGEIIQRLSAQPLDAFARREIFQPLGMTQSFFTPARSLRPAIAPTESDKTFRKRLVRGEVHDENAWAMGGVAGHAGLFSTAGDISIFARMILNGGVYAHRRILRRQTIRRFTARERAGESTRTLGWDVPTPPGSSAGNLFSPSSFGHTGFTGTSLWLDPERDFFVVLLTNRVHPTRANERIRQLRPHLHDAILQALGYGVPPSVAR